MQFERMHDPFSSKVQNDPKTGFQLPHKSAHRLRLEYENNKQLDQLQTPNNNRELRQQSSWEKEGSASKSVDGYKARGESLVLSLAKKTNFLPSRIVSKDKQ